MAKGIEYILTYFFIIVGITMHLFIAFREKKVEAISKEKDCEIVGEWVKSTVNHLFWCAVSTSS